MQLYEVITNWMAEELPLAKRAVNGDEVTFGIWERNSIVAVVVRSV